MKTRQNVRGLLLAALLLMSILLPGCVARQAENEEACGCLLSVPYSMA